LDGLVHIAMDLPGCWGARITGAGFGGCTINLVDNEQVEPFISRLKGEYYHSFGRETAIYHCHAVSGAHLVMS
jgi:galactokinase